MSNELINSRIKRLNEAIKIVKKYPDVHDQKDIALKMGYDRGGTISDYKNPEKYEEEKFTKFVNLFAKTFNLNEDYILNGRGELKSFTETQTPKTTGTPQQDDAGMERMTNEQLEQFVTTTRLFSEYLDRIKTAEHEEFREIIKRANPIDMMANLLYKIDNVDKKVARLEDKVA